MLARVGPVLPDDVDGDLELLCELLGRVAEDVDLSSQLDLLKPGTYELEKAAPGTLPGRVVLQTTPAEENDTAKERLALAGMLDGVDAATKLVAVHGAVFGERWLASLDPLAVERQSVRELDADQTGEQPRTDRIQGFQGGQFRHDAQPTPHSDSG